MPEKVCPVWVAHLMVSPLRKLFQNPRKILSPYIEPGMKVLDVGCAMGFFSLPMAEMAAPSGKVICLDVQEKMLESLERRAAKRGVSSLIETRLCLADSLGLSDLHGRIDFALVFAVVHEVPDAESFFSEISKALKKDAKILFCEPRGHVSKSDFEKSISLAESKGLRLIERLSISRSRSALLRKDLGPAAESVS